MYYTHCCEPHIHGFWIFPFFFIILMIFFAAPLIRRTCGHRAGRGRRFNRGWSTCWRQKGSWWSETPAQILDRRYANGEITKEQYEQMKIEIDSDPSPTEPEGD